MKTGIHPELYEITAQCACGAAFKTRSAKKDIHMTLCSQCHPFYTGEQKYVDTAGRIEKFQRKYANAGKGKKAKKSK